MVLTPSTTDFSLLLKLSGDGKSPDLASLISTFIDTLHPGTAHEVLSQRYMATSEYRSGDRIIMLRFGGMKWWNRGMPVTL